MMTLEELDEDLKKNPPPKVQVPTYGTHWWDLQKDLREKEDKALREGKCPRCPHKVSKEKSKISGTYYYTCENPNKLDCHIFIRTEVDDIP